MNVSMMLLTYILLFLSFCASVFSFPSTPLNERSQEISWQAWLLVDDQNQNQKNSDGTIPRRRITPKSVFVAPTFSPENLPPCAEGYSSDSMGRCIKIIKLDEDRHLEFLVSKLNDKFGVIDYEEDVEEFEMTKSEPFQLNIPLNLDEGDYSNDTPQEDLDFAIIVTPTTRDSDKFDKHGTRVDKRNDQADSDMYEKELKKLLEMATTTTTYTKKDLLESSTIVAEKDETTTDTITTESDILETSTIKMDEDIETTTTVVTTTDASYEEQTTEANEDSEGESTSNNNDMTTSTDATTTLEVTTDNPTTLPPIRSSETSSTTPKHTTPIPKITTYHPRVITYHPYFDTKLLDSSRTKNLIKFPGNQVMVPRNHPDGSFVRFPDVDSKYQQEGQIHHTRDVNEQYGNFFNEIVTSEPSQHVQEMVLPPKGQISRFFPTHGRNFDSGHQNWFYPSRKPSGNSHEYHYEYQIGATAHPPKKSREKPGSLFVIPPKWSENSQHKPLVLRFSRKHFNVDTNKFKNNEFYRSMPMDDLSFLFGYKHGQTDSHR